jgi:DNA-binding protein YbaB
MEMLLDMVNQNVQEALKKLKNNKNKEYEKTQKQINELIGALTSILGYSTQQNYHSK